MILVTVGSMLPFDRLIRAMDEWAGAHPDEKVFAQIGGGDYLPVHMAYERMVPPSRYLELVAEARLIVAHAGTGTVFSAAEAGKPLVMLARHAAAREHTTDHQIDTARWLKGRPGIFIADTEAELGACIAAALDAGAVPEHMQRTAPEDFVARLRDVVFA